MPVPEFSHHSTWRGGILWIDGDRSPFLSDRILEVMEEWFKGRLKSRLAVLLVDPKMGKEKRDAGILVIMLSVIGVILGWVRQVSCLWRDNEGEYHHVPDGAIQDVGTCGRYRILL